MCELLHTAPNFLTPFGWNMDPSANGQQFLAQVQDQILQKDISKPNRKKKKFDTDPIGLEGMDKGKNPKGGNKKFSRVRTSFSQDQQQELETYFTDCMYPNASEIQKLSKKLGLNETTVQVWFQNRRAKWRKPLNLTGIPGRPSASRMNNEQLYKRNPKFIEMQTRAILLQNNRHSTSSPLDGNSATSNKISIGMITEDGKSLATPINTEGHMGVSEGAENRTPMKRSPPSILPMPQSTGVQWMGGTNSPGLNTIADSVSEAGMNPNGPAQLIWYPRPVIYLPPGPTPQHAPIMIMGNQNNQIVPLPTDTQTPKSASNIEFPLDNPPTTSSPPDFTIDNQFGPSNHPGGSRHSIDSLHSNSPHGSNSHLPRSRNSSNHSSIEKIQEGHQTMFHEDASINRLRSSVMGSSNLNLSTNSSMYDQPLLDRTKSIPDMRGKFNPPSQFYPTHVVSYPNLSQACNGVSGQGSLPTHHQHTPTTAAAMDIMHPHANLPSSREGMGSNNSIGTEQNVSNCITPVPFRSDPLGPWPTSSGESVYTSRNSSCQEGQQSIHPPPYNSLRESPKLRSTGGIPELFSNAGGYSRSSKAKTYNFPSSSYQSLGNLPQEVQRNGSLFRDIHHQNSTGSLANDSNSASLHSLHEQSGSSSSINITMTTEGYGTMDLPTSQSLEYNPSQPNTPFSLGTPSGQASNILDDLSSARPIAEDKNSLNQRRYSSPIMGTNRSSLTPMSSRRISGGPPNVEVAANRNDHQSPYY